MADIYAQSQNVAIWLGKEFGEDDNVVEPVFLQDDFALTQETEYQHTVAVRVLEILTLERLTNISEESFPARRTWKRSGNVIQRLHKKRACAWPLRFLPHSILAWWIP